MELGRRFVQAQEIENLRREQEEEFKRRSSPKPKLQENVPKVKEDMTAFLFSCLTQLTFFFCLGGDSVDRLVVLNPRMSNAQSRSHHPMIHSLILPIPLLSNRRTPQLQRISPHHPNPLSLKVKSKSRILREPLGSLRMSRGPRGGNEERGQRNRRGVRSCVSDVRGRRGGRK